MIHGDEPEWKILLKKDVLRYLNLGGVIGDEYPDNEQLDMFSQDNLGCRRCSVEGVTQVNTAMDMGLFGVDDYYFFYHKFVPSQSNLVQGSTFSIWYQIGDENSEWQGAYWDYDSIVTDATEVCTTTNSVETCSLKPGSVYYLYGRSASDLSLNAQTSSEYDDDSWFFGVIDYRPNKYGGGGSSDGKPWVKVIHQVPRIQQTVSDGSIVRIEKNRVLKYNFVDNSQAANLHSITLMSAVMGSRFLAVVFSLAVGILAF